MKHLTNVVAVILGLVIGSVVNMAIILIGPSLIPPPAGVDVTDMESIRANIHLYEIKHFIAPLLAHALGTLSGCVLTYLIATSKQVVLTYVIGGFFLLGGITAAFTIPAPVWFIALDLVLAYIPMAWLAVLIAEKFKPQAGPASA